MQRHPSEYGPACRMPSIAQTPTLAWHVGGATEVIHGTSSPDWRVYTGLNWVFGPVFSEPQEVIDCFASWSFPALRSQGSLAAVHVTSGLGAHVA